MRTKCDISIRCTSYLSLTTLQEIFFFLEDHQSANWIYHLVPLFREAMSIAYHAAAQQQSLHLVSSYLRLHHKLLRGAAGLIVCLCCNKCNSP